MFIPTEVRSYWDAIYLFIWKLSLQGVWTKENVREIFIFSPRNLRTLSLVCIKERSIFLMCLGLEWLKKKYYFDYSGVRERRKECYRRRNRKWNLKSFIYIRKRMVKIRVFDTWLRIRHCPRETKSGPGLNYHRLPIFRARCNHNSHHRLFIEVICNRTQFLGKYLECGYYTTSVLGGSRKPALQIKLISMIQEKLFIFICRL